MTKKGKFNQERPTLKSISRISGLAVATVSRALSDAPDISTATKTRVREIAREINYVPNRAALRLRTGRSNVISLVLPTEMNMMNHTARLISSITQTLQGTPFHLNVMPWMAGDDAMKPVRHIVENELADGMILNSTTPQDPRVTYLQEEGFPFATHGRTAHSQNHAYFDFDNFVFAELALHKLRAKGCKHILALLPPQHMNYGQNMRNGCDRAARALGITWSILENAHADSDQAAISQETCKALKNDPKIDGILASAPMGCMSMVTAAEDLGRILGQDIEIVTREAIPFLKLFRPKLMVAHENVGQAGAFLAQAVMQAINDPSASPMQGLEVPQADSF